MGLRDLRTLLSGAAASAGTVPPATILERYVDVGTAASGGDATTSCIAPTLSAGAALATDTVFSAYAELAARKGRALGRERGLGIPSTTGGGGGGAPGRGGARPSSARARASRPARGAGAGLQSPPPPPPFTTTQEGGGGGGGGGDAGLTLGGSLGLGLGLDDDDEDDDGGGDGDAFLFDGHHQGGDPARRDGGDEGGRRFLRLLASAAGPARALRRSQALQVMALVRAHALHRDPSLSLDAAAFLAAQFRAHPPAVLLHPPAAGAGAGGAAGLPSILAARTGPAAGASAPWTLADGGLMAHPWDQLDDGGGVLGALACGGGGGHARAALGPALLGTPASTSAAAAVSGPTLLSPFASLVSLACAARAVATSPLQQARAGGRDARGGAAPHSLGEVALFSAVVAHLEADAGPRLAAHAAVAGDTRAPAGRRAALLRHSILWRVAFDGALGGGWGLGGSGAPAPPAGTAEGSDHPPVPTSQGTRGLTTSGLAALVGILVETIAGAAAWASVEDEAEGFLLDGKRPASTPAPALPPPPPADQASAATLDRGAAADPAGRLLRLLLALTGAAEAAGDFVSSAANSTTTSRSAPGSGNERVALGSVMSAACLARGGPVWVLADAVERAGGSDPGVGLRAVLTALGPAGTARLAGGAVAGRCGKGKDTPPAVAAALAQAAAALESPAAASDPTHFTPPPSAALAALALELERGVRAGASEAVLVGGGHADHLAGLVAALATAGVALAGGDPAAAASVDDAADAAIAALLGAKDARLCLAPGSRAALAAARSVAAARGGW